MQEERNAIQDGCISIEEITDAIKGLKITSEMLKNLGKHLNIVWNTGMVPRERLED